MSEEILDKNLLEIVSAYSDLIVLDNCGAILRKDYKNMNGKVKIISNGRAGNKLQNIEFVGPGMVTAAILGSTSSATEQNIILRVIEEFEFDYSSGILLIVDDYAEYPINFNLAKFHAEKKGYIVKIIQIPTNNLLSITKEQSFLASLFIYKIAGAMSEKGRNIDEIYSVCQDILTNGELVLLQTECQNIIHEEYKMEMFSNLAKQTFKSKKNILNTIPQDRGNERLYEKNVSVAIDLQINPFATYCAGHEVAIIIDNFGITTNSSFSQLDTYTFIFEILKQTEMCCLKVKRIYLNPLITNLSTKYFNICVLNLSITPILIQYLDFPTTVPAWRKVLTSTMLRMKEDDRINLTSPEKCCKNADMLDMNMKGPMIEHETGKIFLSIISMACEAIIACTKQLDRMSEEFGNGNYGTSLARGSKAIQDAIQENKMLGTNPYTTFIQIGYIIHRTVDGLQGKLYALFFFNIAEAFSKYESDQQVTANIWLNALITANKAIEQFELPSAGDQSLVTALAAVQLELTNALNDNVDPINAFGTAVKTAENFAMDIVNSQFSTTETCKKFKYPYPQAHAVGIWLRAAYEGIKLKSYILMQNKKFL